MASVDGVVAIKEASFDARRFVDTARLHRGPAPPDHAADRQRQLHPRVVHARRDRRADRVRRGDDPRAGRHDRRLEGRPDRRGPRRSAGGSSGSPTSCSRPRSATTGSGSRNACGILGVLESGARPAPAACRSATRSARSWPSVLARGRAAARRRDARRPRQDARRVRRPPASGGESALATEPADVLIIGAGASGGGRRPAARRGRASRWSASSRASGTTGPTTRATSSTGSSKARKDWATSPNIRGLAAGLPDRRGRHPGLAADVQRGRRLDDHLRGRLAARRCRRTSASARSTASPTTGRSTTSSCCPYFYRTDRAVRRVGPAAATRPTRPDAEDAADAAAADRRRRAQGRAGAHEARLALVAGVQLDQLGRRTTAAGRASSASTCQSGCNEGAKASTDLTHWPKAIALGARLVTGARVRRIETNAAGPRDRRDLDRPRRRRALRAGEGRGRSRRTRSGRRGCCCSRPAPAHPDGLANSSGLVGQAADDASVRERRGPVRRAAR